MEQMIRNSNNREATHLIKLVGFQNIATSLQDRDTQIQPGTAGFGLARTMEEGPAAGREIPCMAFPMPRLPARSPDF